MPSHTSKDNNILTPIRDSGLSQFEIEYFIQTRKEIDTEKQERNRLLNYALLATGAFAVALAQIERSTDFLMSPWALCLYIPLLLLITGIVAARRMKLHQIFDRWTVLQNILQTTSLINWVALEEIVVEGIKGRRYLYEDFGLHHGLSAIVYGLIIMSAIRVMSEGYIWLLITGCILIVTHLALSTIWLLNPLKLYSHINIDFMTFKKHEEERSSS